MNLKKKNLHGGLCDGKVLVCSENLRELGEVKYEKGSNRNFSPC